MPIQHRVTKQAVSKAPADRAPDRLSQPLDQVLRDAARRRQLNKGETLYTRGSRPDSIFCVERGAVQLSTTSASGREAVLGVVEGGRWFGELTVFIESALNNPGTRANASDPGSCRWWRLQDSGSINIGSLQTASRF